jgi:hypothetical protein
VKEYNVLTKEKKLLALDMKTWDISIGEREDGVNTLGHKLKEVHLRL